MKRFLVIVALVAWCGVLILSRASRTGSISFLFLVWNLFLAFIPFAASRAMVALHRREHSKVALGLCAIVWLLFLPNAPYILTDLLHLSHRPPVPLWYDLALLLSCAGTGLLMGYASVADVQFVVSRVLNQTIGWLVAISSLVLSAFGIYMGRYLRWNSWDALANPRAVFGDVADRMLNPFAHPRSTAVTAIYGCALVLGYVALAVLSAPRSDPRKTPASEAKGERRGLDGWGAQE